MRTRDLAVVLLGIAGLQTASAADATENMRGGATLMPVQVYTLEDDRKVLKAFDGLRVADVSDGMDVVGLQDIGLVDPEVHALWKDTEKFTHRTVGIAVTARYVPTNRREAKMDDQIIGRWYNSITSEAFMKVLQPGSMLVIDATDDGESRSIGSSNIQSWKKKGMVGLVTSGGLADTDEITYHKVPVYFRRLARGIRPGRNELESVNRPVTIGGVLVRPGDVVVDVGGHIGYYTLLAARAAGPTGHVYAFEPERGNFALLAENVATNGYADRVTAVNKAVMAENGELRIYVSPDNAGDHHVYAVGDDDRPSYGIESVALDSYFADRPDRTVNVIKMDVQGAEPAALRGMRGVLDANDNVLLFTELAPPSLRDAGSSPREYVEALADAGFDLHVIDEEAGTVTHTPADQLAGIGDFGREDFVNLVCSKGTAFAERVRGSETLRLVAAS